MYYTKKELIKIDLLLNELISSDINWKIERKLHDTDRVGLHSSVEDESTNEDSNDFLKHLQAINDSINDYFQPSGF